MTTTKTDTPETDAAFRDGYTFCAEDMMPAVAFCANLERERDAAMKQSAEWEELFHRFGRKSREMEIERDAALRELTELRNDKERLDWLDKNPNDVFSNKDGEYSIGYIANYSQNIRQAIDSAKQTQ